MSMLWPVDQAYAPHVTSGFLLAKVHDFAEGKAVFLSGKPKNKIAEKLC